MSPSHDDRRNHPRHDLTFELQGTQRDDGGTVARMVASNLSLGGLYCTSNIDFPEMTRLAVRLMLPDGGRPEPLDAEAVVVRREVLPQSAAGGRRYEIALYFTKLDTSSKGRLERFLENGKLAAGASGGNGSSGISTTDLDH